LDALERKRY